MPLDGTNFSARKVERFSHVYISLLLNFNNETKMVKALDWNNCGFNFFLDEKIEAKELVFKKDLKEFTGRVVWGIKNDDDSTILEMIINNKLLKHLEQQEEKKEDLISVFKMIRSVGILEKKKDLLSTFGIKLTINDIEKEMDYYIKKNPLYRYGIEPDSEEWKEICNQTLETSPPKTTTNPIDELINKISNSE
jgi:hypothetical protein